ncbi:hypothetical protein AMTR_s00005p00261300, partial [Amborella trichopoda]
RLNWALEHDKIMFETMVEVGATNRKKKYWIATTYVMREAYRLMFTIDRLKSRVRSLKFLYINLKQLLVRPGFQFDEGTRKISGLDWEEYIQGNEAFARKFDK